MCVCVYMNLSVTAILVTMICQYACMHTRTHMHAHAQTRIHTHSRSFLLNKLHSKEKDIVLPQAGVRPESRRVRAILELVLH